MHSCAGIAALLADWEEREAAWEGLLPTHLDLGFLLFRCVIWLHLLQRMRACLPCMRACMQCAQPQLCEEERAAAESARQLSSSLAAHSDLLAASPA